MNINEIAELAGVSRATVSRYLNDGYVSEEKRAAIRKVIEEKNRCSAGTSVPGHALFLVDIGYPDDLFPFA